MSTEAERRQRVLDATSALWREIQRRHVEVPDVVLTWAPAGGRRAKALPLHLHSGPWSGELLVSDERLVDGVNHLTGVVLHEAVHALAAARGVVETSNNGRYHNAKYQALADELGLVAAESPGWGWSETTLAPDTAAAYRGGEPYVQLQAALVLYEPPEVAAAPAASDRGRNYAVATCGCVGAAARPMRMSPAKFALGPIVCGVCHEPFVERPSG